MFFLAKVLLNSDIFSVSTSFPLAHFSFRGIKLRLSERSLHWRSSRITKLRAGTRETCRFGLDKKLKLTNNLKVVLGRGTRLWEIMKYLSELGKRWTVLLRETNLKKFRKNWKIQFFSQKWAHVLMQESQTSQKITILRLCPLSMGQKCQFCSKKLKKQQKWSKMITFLLRIAAIGTKNH